jgi:hypothetical protein
VKISLIIAKRAGAIAAAVALLAACAGPRFSWDTARQMKLGMSEAEVTALMGPPSLVRAQGGRHVWVWSHANVFEGSRAVSAVFEEGKVVATPDIPARFQ